MALITSSKRCLARGGMLTDLELREKYNLYVKRKGKQNRYSSGSNYVVDSEMTKVYRCEWKLQREFPIIHEVLSKNCAEKYVDRILKSKYWKDNAQGKRIIVEWYKDMGGRRAVNGTAYGSSIKLSPSGSSKYVIIHELVHCMGYMNHGRGFRNKLVEMTSRFLGRDVAKQLKKNFREAKLKMNKPRPILTYEEWVEKWKKYNVE